jgi:zinc transporter ZupT
MDKRSSFVNDHAPVRPRGADRERRDRSGIAVLLDYGEFFIDTVVALALIVGGTMLLGVVVYDFVRGLGQGPFTAAVLELLSGLLLVFIFTELITTIRSLSPAGGWWWSRS